MKVTVNSYEAIINKPKNVKFTLIGDFHGYYNRDDFKDYITKVNDLDSEALLVAGDICQGKTWQQDDNFQKLHYVMSAFAERQPVVLIVGNHDLSKFNDVAKKNYKKLGTIKNVYPLFNENLDLITSNDNKLHISGLVTDKDNYITAGGNFKTKLFNRADEREQEIIEDIKRLKREILKEDDINILLSHDPRQTRMNGVYDEAKEYDIITGAHVHNGYMPNFITSENDKLLDKDWLGVPTGGLVKDRNYTRGVIYGTKDYHVQQLPTGQWYLVEREKFTPITEDEAVDIITKNYYSKNNFTPTVITGGINKYVGVPIDSAEITHVELNGRQK